MEEKRFVEEQDSEILIARQVAQVPLKGSTMQLIQGCRNAVPGRITTRQQSLLCDNDRPQSTNHYYLWKVSLKVNQDLKLDQDPDQDLREVAVHHSGQIGP